MTQFLIINIITYICVLLYRLYVERREEGRLLNLSPEEYPLHLVDRELMRERASGQREVIVNLLIFSFLALSYQFVAMKARGD